ncbi:hypothetical protein R1sor_024061 [Riccia sorocarpa]|uniref:Reverse transcriptase domain-containing protein n=1 Tax=Riccia sorocarpa TaxID=122646 RepID=A0ABD3GPE4_9MARC
MNWVPFGFWATLIRVGDAQSLELNEEGVAVWRNSDADESWCRSAEDEGRNGMSEFFMQFATAGGLTIVNGTAPFPDTRSITCRTHNGSSTVDFLLACKSVRDRILDFSFGPFSHESDHRPLRCTLMGFEREIRCQYRRSKVGVCLDVTKRNQYEKMLGNKLHGRELTSGTLANIITCVAKEVFTAKQPRDKGWFDEDCHVARCKAMSEVDQRAAFRLYNHFIRARKLRFLRQHQRVLVGELMKCPKTFWERFCSRRILPELKAEDMYKYVRQLYFFPTAGVMSRSQRPACIFSEDEVTQELRRLGANKAVDLVGLSAEILRWGGPVLRKELALMLSKASCEGLPAAWTHHKVVPLYKQGPRNDPASYRTIMVASIFAKLYGRILEGRLSRWCEEKGVHAPAQAGFRRNHSTLDHSLTLRVILEEAKRSKKPLYVLFVPAELLAAITVLYEKVLVKIKADDHRIESTLGVIQGCPLSPTLFGLLIDVLYEYVREHEEGFALGTQSVSVLLFADDVVLIANSESKLHRLVRLLETFCHQSEMSVNLSKTKWLRRGPGLAEPVMFQGQPIAEYQKYKYLGLEFISNLAWSDCVKARTASALRALYAFKSKCYNLGQSLSKSEFLHKSTADIHTRHSKSHMQGVGLQIYIAGLHNGSSLKKTEDRRMDCVIVLPKRSFGSFGLSLVRDKLIIYATFPV